MPSPSTVVLVRNFLTLLTDNRESRESYYNLCHALINCVADYRFNRSDRRNLSCGGITTVLALRIIALIMVAGECRDEDRDTGDEDSRSGSSCIVDEDEVFFR